MSVQLISVIVLCGIFAVATALPVHMGALSLGAAFVLGMAVLEGTLKARVDQVAAGFPGSLFVVLAGVTFLFAIARNNGTVDWLVRSAVRAVGGRVSLLPWVFFFVTALMTALGAVVPAAVAMIAPLGMGLAVRYGMNPVLVGLMIANGATAGAFSPIGIFGSITNGVVTRNALPGSPVTLFVASFAFNVVLAAVTALMFGQRAGGSGQQAIVSDAASDAMIADAPVTRHQILTVVSLLGLATGALFFGLDVGFSAFVVVVILSLADPKGTKGAVDQIAWSTVLLVCGIVTYVTLMEKLGTITYLGDAAARIGTPLVAALVICYIGGVVSAFASTTGILGALIPLAVPFLKGPGAVGAVGLIAALAISSSVVDSSPFSTTGSLVVANAPADQRDRVFRRLMQWGFTMVALAPVATWLILVVPGWL